jgi:hypothetical protein
MSKLTKTLLAPQRAIAWIAPLTLGLILTSLSGCKEVMVISADQTEAFVKSNSVFQAPVDGVFMSTARYQRYRRAVADKIQEAETRSNTPR